MLRRPFITCAGIMILAGIFNGCAPSSQRLQESGLNTEFAFDGEAPFAEYILKTRQMMEAARVDLDDGNKAAVIEANSPFELQPDADRYPRAAGGKFSKGILLVHGLTDSPYYMRSVANHLRAKGFLVRSILLPGHGTVPADLVSVGYREWIKATEYGMHRLRTQAEKVYVGGLSTGGALSVHYGLTHQDVAGIVLFSPALGIKSGFAWLSGVAAFFKDWLSVRDDLDYAKYESFATNGGYQVYRLTRVIDTLFSQKRALSVPVFAVLSADDMVVEPEKTVAVFSRYLSSDKNGILFYAQKKPAYLRDAAAEIILENSYLPGERIYDFSHNAILIPPDDPHYGRDGDYRSCAHYKPGTENNRICLTDPAVWQGEFSEKNLAKGVMRRLTYNPLHQEMLHHLDRFLERVESE